MLDFTHQETIHAPPEAVFDLMADLQNYNEWNPFVTVESGTARMGEVVTGKARLRGREVPYRHKIYEFIPGKRLSWKDFGLLAWLVCGNRSRSVESVGGATLFTCHLVVTGPLSLVVKMLFGKSLCDGVVAEAKALKEMAFFPQRVKIIGSTSTSRRFSSNCNSNATAASDSSS